MRQTRAARQLATEFSSVMEFSPWRSPSSSTLKWLTERRGRLLHLLCFGSDLGKLLKQLLFVACNAVSSYPTANSLLPPNRPQSWWKEEKLPLLLTLLGHVSIESSSFPILPPQTLYGIEDASMESFTQCWARYYPALCQHSFSNSNRLYKFQKESENIRKGRKRRGDSECIFTHFL